MSEMVKRYEESSKPRPAQAKQIPGLAVNFVDQNNEYQEGFTTFQKKGDPTKWTGKALSYYDEERKNASYPEGFQPVEPGATPNQWGPEKKYFNPGQAQG
jgi:hypothetical protein